MARIFFVLAGFSGWAHGLISGIYTGAVSWIYLPDLFPRNTAVRL